ncbi:MAG: type II toxin-antitoxin system VapC family toxin [Spirochaetaceae bacterium]
MYLLDTNICIYAIKNRPLNVLKKISENFSDGIYISSLTVAELEFGVSNSQNPEKNRIALLEFISIFSILPFNEKDAVPYGKIKATLRKLGKIIGPIDLLLAGQAISNELTFITNNTKEFLRVPGIKLEDWSIE